MRPNRSKGPPMRRRASSSVTLLITSTSVFRYSTEGSRKCCDAGTGPCRITIALEYAANDIVIAAMPTHTPVRAGDGGDMLLCIATPPPPQRVDPFA